jgi:hypothetical protein
MPITAAVTRSNLGLRLAAVVMVPALLLVGCPDCEDTVCVVGEDLAGGLLSVLAVEPDDVWVVGSSPDPEATDATPGPAALNWDGDSWATLDTAEWDGVELWWVWATADEAVFVGSRGAILELDRGSGAVTQVDGPDAETTFFGVWGASADDLWAVGQTLGATGPPALWRRGGGTWAAWEDPTLGPGDDGQVYFKVHGRVADDVWIVGSGGAALHWDGVTLTQVPTDTEVDTSTSPLLTVDAGGERPVAVGGFGNALTLEFDGTLWRDTSPGPGTFQPGMNGVCSGSGGSLTAVGQTGSRLHDAGSGGGWQTDIALEIDSVTQFDWHACDYASDGALWTVGGRIASRPLRDGVVAYTGPGSPAAIE